MQVEKGISPKITLTNFIINRIQMQKHIQKEEEHNRKTTMVPPII